MWRTRLIDSNYITAMRAAIFNVALRGNAVMLGIFGVVAIVVTIVMGMQGDWSWAILTLIFLVLMPWSMWRQATAAANRYQKGTYVAFAVTPDGTLHTSTISGTTTINPGHVTKVMPAKDAWFVIADTGVSIPVPRDMLTPDEIHLLDRTAITA